VEEGYVGGEGFDLGEVVGGEQDGEGFGGRCGCGGGFESGAVEESFDELVADEGIEAGEGLVEDDERGAEGEGLKARG
jgi:hypothetical protein